MAHVLKVAVSEGCLRGKESSIRLSAGLELIDNAIVIKSYDILVFGRAADCGICLPEDDGQVSRHHFVLEVNPPVARIRDLGSLNGTHINGRKIGARAKGQTPDEAQNQVFPSVDLKDGDQIKVGKSLFTVAIHSNPTCWCCGNEVPAGAQEECLEPGDTLVYPVCKDCLALAGSPNLPNAAYAKRAAFRCQTCGKDAKPEAGRRFDEGYVCNECRGKAAEDMGPEAGLDEADPAKPVIPGYEIGEKLGNGGCGAVYMAKNLESGETVALKVMLAKVAVSQKARNDFQREIRATNELRHPNIVSLLDHGVVGATFYFAMEYCRAGSLGRLMHRQGGRLSLQQAAPIMLDALKGLAYCHLHNVVHRDLKPDNILLAALPDRRLRGKIADLGLAKNFTAAGLSGMTVTGHFAGTYEYMAREQLTHFKFVQPASDVWSIGATFYQALTGRLPHDFPPKKDPIKVVLQDAVVPIRERDPSIPKPVADVIDRSLSIHLAERFKNAGEMKKALASAL